MALIDCFFLGVEPHALQYQPFVYDIVRFFKKIILSQDCYYELILIIQNDILKSDIAFRRFLKLCFYEFYFLLYDPRLWWTIAMARDTNVS